jgi:hypothetical protein
MSLKKPFPTSRPAANEKSSQATTITNGSSVGKKQNDRIENRINNTWEGNRPKQAGTKTRQMRSSVSYIVHRLDLLSSLGVVRMIHSATVHKSGRYFPL